MTSATLIYFSPTGTTKKLLHSIAKGYTPNCYSEIDLTKDSSDETPAELLIIGVPVYAGRVPDPFLERFKNIDIKKRECIIVVVYGNRAYEDALLELQDLVEGKGGSILGAGAFIAEHSLSREQQPIAKNRPDEQDLNKAYQFGKEVSLKTDLKNIKVPGNRPYKEKNPKTEVIMKTDETRCTLCSKCIAVCPVDAIVEPLNTDGKLCLRCSACVRVCENKARSLQDTLSTTIAQRLFETCQERKEPELFI